MNLRITKIDAAKRQIDVAIRLLFSNEDPVAIHTIMAAGFQVIRDIARHQNKDFLKAYIVPGKEKQFWGAVNKIANFYKHADRDPDPDNFIEVSTDTNELLLFLACALYQNLEYELSHEMNAFVGWFSAIYPDLVLESNPLKPWVTSKEMRSLQRAKRVEQLKIGREMLVIAKKMKGAKGLLPPGQMKR